jgi:hypothetical protein
MNSQSARTENVLTQAQDQKGLAETTFGALPQQGLDQRRPLASSNRVPSILDTAASPQELGQLATPGEHGAY